ncbi:UNVERIFIED_CONTAM: movement protein [Sesamum calycinum]|uniref:Movement protein n=1 Tax=Sesamum calycinum TaxID=2727403 RepID=A0AAW2LI22_9LAMI
MKKEVRGSFLIPQTTNVSRGQKNALLFESAVNCLADQDFSRVLTLPQDFKRKNLMKEGNRPYSITYKIVYALSNTHHSDMFLRKEYIEIPRIFKEFAKKDDIDLDYCKFCGEARYKVTRERNHNYKKTPYAILDRGRIYVSPSNAKAWRHFDRAYPNSSAEPRNIRLGLCPDGLIPH